jgi:ActR/RegA family two-component response regulator
MSFRRLLVLDDDNQVAATICRMARTVGYETDHTSDADIFMERLIAWKPTHVSVDLQLADRDGIEVISRLGEMGCKASLLIISGLGARIVDSSARAACEHGLRVLASLNKPVSLAKIRAVLTSDLHMDLGVHESSHKAQKTQTLTVSKSSL